MAKDKKFLALLEKYQERFEQKGFLVGDVFKFNDNFKSHEAYKALPANVKDVLDHYIESGLHIRVRQADGGDEIVIAQDHGGGRFVGNVTIPCALGEPVDFGANLPPVPEVQRREDKVTIKPEEVPALPTDATDMSNAAPTDDNFTTNPHLKEEDEEVVAESYTKKYL